MDKDVTIEVYKHSDSPRFGFRVLGDDKKEVVSDGGFSSPAMATFAAGLAIGKLDGEQKSI